MLKHVLCECEALDHTAQAIYLQMKSRRMTSFQKGPAHAGIESKNFRMDVMKKKLNKTSFILEGMDPESQCYMGR